MLMENLGAMAYTRYTGFREITDRNVLELHCIYICIRARENRKNSRSGPKLRILDRFQTPQNANKSVQHFPNQPIFTN